MENEALRDNLESLSLVREVVERKLQKHLADQRQRRNSMIPIFKNLPSEVFCQILRSSVVGYPFKWDLRRVQELRLISRYFNERVCSMPRLWAVLDSSFAKTPGRIHRIIQLSKAAPLSIYIAPSDSPNQILQAALPFIHRWRHVQITCAISPAVAHLFTQPMASLESVALGEPTGLKEADFLQSELLFAGDAPRLTKVHVALMMLAGPKNWRVVLRSVSDLHLHGLERRIDQIQEILTSRRDSLTHLQLSFNLHPERKIKSPINHIVLPNLEYLRVKGTFQEMSFILQWLKIPRCSYYHLQGHDDEAPESENIFRVFWSLANSSPLLAQSSFAMKFEDTRVYVNAIHFDEDDDEMTMVEIVIQASYSEVIAGHCVASRLFRNTTELQIKFDNPAPRDAALTRLMTPDQDGWRFPNLGELWVLGYPERSVRVLVARRNGWRPVLVSQHPLPVRLERLCIMSVTGERNPPDFLPAIEATITPMPAINVD